MTDSPLPLGDPEPPRLRPGSPGPHRPAMQAFVDDRRVPNLVTLVARRGRLVHRHACGVLDLEEAAPAGVDTLFRMWSNTKPIAGVATLILYERGLLTPDDPRGEVPTRVRQSAGSRPRDADGNEASQARHHHPRLPHQYHRARQPGHHAALLPAAIS